MSHLGSSLRAYNVRSRLKVVAIIIVVVDAVVVVVVVRKGLTNTNAYFTHLADYVINGLNVWFKSKLEP